MSTLLMGLGGTPEHDYTCSRAGCGTAAQWMIQWRNPKIHPEDRRKVWLACSEHVDFLREFLAARDFPLEVVPTPEEAAEVDPQRHGSDTSS